MKLPKKGQRMVKIIDVAGSRTATVQTVESVDKRVVRLVDSSLTYDAVTLEEREPPIPGCHSYLVWFDDGEEKRVLKKAVRP